MRWQDLPTSTHIQDTAYGPQPPQLPLSPYSAGPETRTPADWLAFMKHLTTPITKQQNEAMARIGMPAQLPTNPIAGSLPSGLAFMGNLPFATDKPVQTGLGGKTDYVPDRSIMFGGGDIGVDPSIRAHGGWSPALPGWPGGLTLNSLPSDQ